MSGRDPDQPGPVWPPSLWISPTKLKAFSTCPHRVRLQYIDKVPSPQPFNLFLQQGTIAHNMLADAAKRIRSGVALRSADELLVWATRGMHPQYFPSPDARESAAQTIVRWVQYGIGHIDHEAEFLLIERNSSRTMPWRPAGTRLTVSTRPDLILYRTDAEGERFVEIVDYKTGSQWMDEVPPVTMRFVCKDVFQKIATDTSTLRMQFTYVYLEHRETEVIALTPEYCAMSWGKVTDTIELMMAEREWPVRPSRLCNYCPYNGSTCTAFAEMEPESAADW